MLKSQIPMLIATEDLGFGILLFGILAEAGIWNFKIWNF